MRAWQLLTERGKWLFAQVAASSIKVFVKAPKLVFGILTVHFVSVGYLLWRKGVEKFNVLLALCTCGVGHVGFTMPNV